MKENRMIKQLQQVTKLLVVLLLLPIFSSGSLYGQDSSSLASVRLTAEAELMATDTRIPLEQFLDKLEQTYRVTFLYQPDVVEDEFVNSQQVALNQMTGEKLVRILTNLGLNYTLLDEQTYVLFEKNKRPVPKIQQETISGTVTNGQTGEPIANVNIIVRGTNMGATTNAEGHYSLQVSSLQDTLVFSFVGFESEVVPINGRTEINITLKPQAVMAEELVVVGYGTQEKKITTGSSVAVTSEDITSTHTMGAVQALQGQTAGVQITSTSGQPGSDLKVRIRGIGTIGDASPLFVVDGVPTDDISYLNPAVIKRIDILKDAASAAIYGARASNGVVLITTKQGQEGSTQLSINSYYGVQNFYKTLDMLNAKEYAIIMNEASINSGLEPIFSPEQIRNMGSGTNWLNEAMNRDAPMQNHTITLSGGNEASTYMTSLSYFQQEGIIGGNLDKSNFERITFTVNSEHKLWKDIVTLGENLTYARVNSSGLRVAGLYNNSLRGFFNASPTFPVYNSEGEFAKSNMDPSNETNPIGALHYQDFNDNSSDQIVGNIYAELEPIEGLVFRSDFGFDMSYNLRKSFSPVYRLNAIAYNNISSATQGSTRNTKWSWNNTLEYSHSYRKHNFEVLVGMTALKSTSTWMDATKEGLIFNDFEHAFLNNGTSDSTIVATGSRYEYALYSQFGRINYNFDEKYMFSVTVRRDGSSNFGPNNRYGIFPAVSVGWILTEEPFFSDIAGLNFLKLRASWGQNGNDRIQNFAYMATLESSYRGYYFGSGSGTKYIGTSPDKIANPNLKWETSEQIDIGLDATFFNKVDLTIDWYKKTTEDWLLVAPVPDLVGANAPTINGGTIENQGLEVALSYSNTFGDVFFSISANGAYNKNEVTAINNEEKIIHGDPDEIWQGIGEVNRVQVGYPVGYFWGYKVAGIFQNEEAIQNYRNNNRVIQPEAVPGDVKFVDLNGDGQLTVADKTQIGNPNPDFTFGFNVNVAYKGFDAAIYAYGMAGHQNVFSVRERSRWYHNYTTDILNRWHGEGTSNTMPRVTRGNEPNRNWKRFSELYIENADFLRIKTITLGYDFALLFEDLPFRKFRVYISANNLFTITSYKGMDPEVGFGPSTSPTSGITYNMSRGFDLGYYPKPRTFLVGLNIKF